MQCCITLKHTLQLLLQYVHRASLILIMLNNITHEGSYVLYVRSKREVFYEFDLHIFPFLVSLSLSTLWLHDASAGAGLSGGRERGGPAVQDYFSGDSRRGEYEEDEEELDLQIKKQNKTFCVFQMVLINNVAILTN